MHVPFEHLTGPGVLERGDDRARLRLGRPEKLPFLGREVWSPIGTIESHQFVIVPEPREDPFLARLLNNPATDFASVMCIRPGQGPNACLSGLKQHSPSC